MITQESNEQGIYCQQHLQCPACDADIRVGTGRRKNFELHYNSKACNQQAAAKPPPKKEKYLLTFFHCKAQLINLPQVASPPPVHANLIPIQKLCENHTKLTASEP